MNLTLIKPIDFEICDFCNHRITNCICSFDIPSEDTFECININIDIPNNYCNAEDIDVVN